MHIRNISLIKSKKKLYYYVKEINHIIIFMRIVTSVQCSTVVVMYVVTTLILNCL